MELFLPLSDAEAARREIKHVICRQITSGEPEQGLPPQYSSGQTAVDISALRDGARLVRLSAALVGHLPPEPSTLRGRVGAWVIRGLRRALFWYTPAILEFHRNVTRAVEQQTAAIDQILQENASLRGRVDQLQNLAQELLRESAAEKRIQLARDSAVQQLRNGVTSSIEQMQITAAEHAEKLGVHQAHLQSQNSALEQLRGAAADNTGGLAVQQVDLQSALAEIAALKVGTSQLSSMIEDERVAATREYDAMRQAAHQQMCNATQAQAEAWNRITRMFEDEAAAREAVGAEWVTAHNRLGTVEGRLAHTERKLVSVRDGLLSQEMRLTVVLEEARKRFGEMDAGQLSALVREDAHKLDSFYLTFEDQFRGTRQDVKERLRVYLPLLKERAIGVAEMPILDVGCGRGEWLEVLREGCLEATGVDSNRSMLACCRERKLEAIEGDAITYLRGLAAESLGGVTGFHIIEHLPFWRLVDLLDETVRVLKPGGVAIFETPNPANVLVSSERFYFDPTHRNPLPSPLMRFLAEERGFCRVEVLELHPWPDAFLLPKEDSSVAERFNQLFYGPQDYAIIGWKV